MSLSDPCHYPIRFAPAEWKAGTSALVSALFVAPTKTRAGMRAGNRECAKKRFDAQASAHACVRHWWVCSHYLETRRGGKEAGRLQWDARGARGASNQGLEAAQKHSVKGYAASKEALPLKQSSLQFIKGVKLVIFRGLAIKLQNRQVQSRQMKGQAIPKPFLSFTRPITKANTHSSHQLQKEFCCRVLTYKKHESKQTAVTKAYLTPYRLNLAHDLAWSNPPDKFKRKKWDASNLGEAVMRKKS